MIRFYYESEIILQLSSALKKTRTGFLLTIINRCLFPITVFKGTAISACWHYKKHRGIITAQPGFTTALQKAKRYTFTYWTGMDNRTVTG
jgi:hypothetical protein